MKGKPEKFTVVYNERWQAGSNWHSITKFKRVLKKANETVLDCLIKHDLEHAEYLFIGWPKLQGE